MPRLPSITAVLAAALLAGCCDARGESTAATVPPPPEAPAACRDVPAGEPIQPLLDDPAAGDALCLGPGAHAGPLRVTRAVTVWGPRDAVIAVAEPGTVVHLGAAGAALVGVTVDGTAGRFDRFDAGVSIRGDRVRVEGVVVRAGAFGIIAERSRGIRIAGNHVLGGTGEATGMRGDTIRLWETHDSEIAGNLVEDGRDVVVWYSRGNRIVDNRIVRARYGAHFMYSHDTVVEGNAFTGGVVGVFVMYSRGITLRHNLIADAAGAAGMAIGLKEAGNVVIEGNRLIHDTTAIYLDTTPFQRGDTVEIRGNVLRLNATGIAFHATARPVAIHDNDLADNDVHVRVDGGGHARDADWRGNYFDDYAGYDLDGDGDGDVPYELRSFAGQLVGRHPELALLRGTFALGLVDAAAHLDPLFLPPLLLVDPAPRVAPRWSAERWRPEER